LPVISPIEHEMAMLDFAVLSTDGRMSELTVPIRTVVNAGYAGRNSAAIQAHIAELARDGVAPPPDVPMFYRLPRGVVCQEAIIEVTGHRTSGEVEYVLVVTSEGMLVTVGSDHTDREAERSNVAISKQICPNIVAREAWDFESVARHWDELVLRLWVTPEEGLPAVLYQEGLCAELLPPTALLDQVVSRLPEGTGEGLVVFSGTVPMIEPLKLYGGSVICELEDPRLNRLLRCRYDVRQIRLNPVAVGARV